MSEFTEADRTFMYQALELACEAKGRTFPNPAVGAVVVNRGTIVGRGATDVCGGPHAERVALRKAGRRARGATLYVTLEPCCHFGRTPPCTDAVIESGVARVVVAVNDPNPLVSGKGNRTLRKQGIVVETGLLREDAAVLNEDFFWAITRKRAWVTLKLAMTLDGRIADTQGASKWITSEQSRRFVHELRRRHAAVAVGRTTLDRDNPRLTARHGTVCVPARIVFSPDKRIPSDSYFYRNANEARSIVVVRGGRSRSIGSEKSGIEIWHTGTTDKRDSIESFLEMAAQQHLPSILIEGGQRLASQFLEYGFVNRVYLFYGNRIVGKGPEGIVFSEGLPMASCIRLRKPSTHLIGPDLMITGQLAR